MDAENTTETENKPKKKRGKSPTQRSNDWLRKRGYRPGIVEKWNSFMKIRQDLWGVVDLLALGDGEVIAVQTTTLTHVNDRLAKIQSATDKAGRLVMPDIERAGLRFHIHGWRQIGRRWYVKVVDAYSGETIEDTAYPA